MKMIFNKKTVLQSSAGGRGSAASSGGRSGGIRGAAGRALGRARSFVSGLFGRR